jgi:hypothetical protein
MALGTTLSYDAWNNTLLETLLPRSAGRPNRLLACDDGAVETAGRELGAPRNESVSAFVLATERQWHIRGSGLADAGRSAAFFVRAERPRPTPDFLGVCCLLVLAASRMNADAEVTSSAYYYRLMAELLARPAAGLRDTENGPRLFHLLADWLVDDLRGERGALLLPDAPQPRYVGVPISQCVFRERDRTVLYDFFDARHVIADSDYDVVALLRAWPGRSALTRHANRVIDDPRLEKQVRTAIWTARATWDESTVVLGGGHRFRGTLRLRERPPVTLLLSSPAPEPLPVGEQTLQPGREVKLDPLELLPELRKLTVVHGDAANRVAIPAAGDTLIFELDPERGLIRVNAASAEHVHLLSARPDLIDHFAGYDAEAEDDLPQGWHLLSRVPTGHLPQDLRRPEKVERPPLQIEGGLRIGRLTYVQGGAPRLQAGELDIPVVVDLRGTDPPRPTSRLARLASGESLELATLPSGTWELSAAEGAFTKVIRIQETGPRQGWGSLTWRPESSAHRRLGVHAPDPGSAAGWGASGAAVEGIPSKRLPLQRTSRAPVTLVARDGRSRYEPASLQDTWLERLGLKLETGRWEVDVSDDIAWVVGRNDVVAAEPVVPERLDAGAVRALVRLPAQPRLRMLVDVDRTVARAAFERLRNAAEDAAR